jgi:hypothetical protein
MNEGSWDEHAAAEASMLTVASGTAAFLITSTIFWLSLPSGERTHRFVGTELEPYVAVAFCGGFALSFSMILSGVLGMLGN